MRYIVKKENAETIYISGGIFVSNGKWTHPKMILDDYELVIVLKGRFQMRIGQARKEFLEGDCFILFPGEEHIGIEAAWDVSFYWLLLFNTIRISLLRLLCGFVPPIILSIMLFDMTSKKFRRISQSILYIPHFFSWVIVYAIVQVLFQNTGYINSFLGFIGVEAKQFLMSERC